MLDPGAHDHAFCFQNVAKSGAWELCGGLEFFEHLVGDFYRSGVIALAVKAVPHVPAGVLAADDFEFGQGCVAACLCLALLQVFKANQGFVGRHWLPALGRAVDDGCIDSTGLSAEPVKVRFNPSLAGA